MIYIILSLFFVFVTLVLIILADFWATRKRNEAFHLCECITSDDQLIPMKGRLVVVSWQTAFRYYFYKQSIYERLAITLHKYSIFTAALATGISLFGILIRSL